jgi:hypothetical protein
LRTSLYQEEALPEMRLGIEGTFVDGQIEAPERHVSVHDWEFPGLDLQLEEGCLCFCLCLCPSLRHKYYQNFRGSRSGGCPRVPVRRPMSKGVARGRRTKDRAIAVVVVVVVAVVVIAQPDQVFEKRTATGKGVVAYSSFLAAFVSVGIEGDVYRDYPAVAMQGLRGAKPIGGLVAIISHDEGIVDAQASVCELVVAVVFVFVVVVVASKRRTDQGIHPGGQEVVNDLLELSRGIGDNELVEVAFRIDLFELQCKPREWCCLRCCFVVVVVVVIGWALLVALPQLLCSPPDQRNRLGIEEGSSGGTEGDVSKAGLLLLLGSRSATTTTRGDDPFVRDIILLLAVTVTS